VDIGVAGNMALAAARPGTADTTITAATNTPDSAITGLPASHRHHAAGLPCVSSTALRGERQC
jgi:hypothetical protein